MHKASIDVPELPTVPNFALLDRLESIYINTCCTEKNRKISSSSYLRRTPKRTLLLWSDAPAFYARASAFSPNYFFFIRISSMHNSVNRKLSIDRIIKIFILSLYRYVVSVATKHPDHLTFHTLYMSIWYTIIYLPSHSLINNMAKYSNDLK